MCYRNQSKSHNKKCQILKRQVTNNVVWLTSLTLACYHKLVILSQLTSSHPTHNNWAIVSSHGSLTQAWTIMRGKTKQRSAATVPSMLRKSQIITFGTILVIDWSSVIWKSTSPSTLIWFLFCFSFNCYMSTGVQHTKQIGNRQTLTSSQLCWRFFSTDWTESLERRQVTSHAVTPSIALPLHSCWLWHRHTAGNAPTRTTPRHQHCVNPDYLP